jgi:hypothetical protein
VYGVPPHPPFSPSPSSRLALALPALLRRLALPLRFQPVPPANTVPISASSSLPAAALTLPRPWHAADAAPSPAGGGCARGRRDRPCWLLRAYIHNEEAATATPLADLPQVPRFASTTPVRFQCDSYTSAFFSSKPALRGRIPPGRHCLLRLCSPSIIRVRRSSGGSLKISFSQIHSPSPPADPRDHHLPLFIV